MSKELFLWENYIPRKTRKNLLTLKLPLVTKTEFLLNTSIQYQADEMRIKKNIIKEIPSWSKNKFSELTS